MAVRPGSSASSNRPRSNGSTSATGWPSPRSTSIGSARRRPSSSMSRNRPGSRPCGATIEDTGRALSRYVDAIVLRTFEQERLEVLAGASGVPVVNALSDFEHPCQCLADLLTIREVKGDLAGRTLVYLGDGNNVTHSLLLGGAMAGMRVRAATPPGFEPIPQVVQRAREIASETGGA